MDIKIKRNKRIVDMKKNIALCLLVPGMALSAANDASQSALKSEAMRPADVIITAIVNMAHNPVSVVNAKGYKQNGGDIGNVSCTIPAGKSTMDDQVCKRRLCTVLAFNSEHEAAKCNDLSGFHITTGHGTYTFANLQDVVAALQLTKDGLKVAKKKALLAPWSEARNVELVVGHDGKMEMRLPGSLAKRVRGEKSKMVKK